MDANAVLKITTIKFKNPLEITISLSVAGPRESDQSMLPDSPHGLL